jgi:hypothetical protein
MGNREAGTTGKGSQLLNIETMAASRFCCFYTPLLQDSEKDYEFTGVCISGWLRIWDLEVLAGI